MSIPLIFSSLRPPPVDPSCFAGAGKSWGKSRKPLSPKSHAGGMGQGLSPPRAGLRGGIREWSSGGESRLCRDCLQLSIRNPLLPLSPAGLDCFTAGNRIPLRLRAKPKVSPEPPALWVGLGRNPNQASPETLVMGIEGLLPCCCGYWGPHSPANNLGIPSMVGEQHPPCSPRSPVMALALREGPWRGRQPVTVGMCRVRAGGDPAQRGPPRPHGSEAAAADAFRPDLHGRNHGNGCAAAGCGGLRGCVARRSCSAALAAQVWLHPKFGFTPFPAPMQVHNPACMCCFAHKCASTDTGGGAAAPMHTPCPR